MIISSRQAIVLGVSLAAFIGGGVGLVIVSRMPPPEPPQKSNLGVALREKWERKMGLKRIEQGPPTSAPPLANNAGPKTGSGQPEKAAKAADAKKADPTKAAKLDDETIAANMLKEAKEFVAKKDVTKAKERCQRIVDKYQTTKAAADAVILMNELQ